MPTFLATSVVPFPRDEVFAWHMRAGALRRLCPPFAPVDVPARAASPRAGQRIVLPVRVGWAKVAWESAWVGVSAGEMFEDVQVRGPFRRWRHVHEFADGPSPGTCRVTDRIEFEAPAGRLGERLGRVRERMAQGFVFRHARLRRDLERLAAFDRARGSTEAMRVVVSGSSGLIGSALCDVLTTGGHEVVRLVRGVAGTGEATFRPGAGAKGGEIDAPALEGADAVVHLAGEPVTGGRLTKARMQAIRESRVEGTRLVSHAVASLRERPRVLVCASGVGWYGDRGDQELVEDTGVGSGFFAELARDWEAASEHARQAGVRVVNLRMGAVLGAGGGVLGLARPWFRRGLGVVPGAGGQWWSWLSLEDTVTAILHVIACERAAGPVNAVSPYPARAGEFCASLARVMDRPLLARAPEWAVRWVGGGRADWVLASARVMPGVLRRTGMKFGYERLEDALRWEMGLARGPDEGVGVTFG